MAHVRDTGERRRVRSLFVSDVHLGSRFAQAEDFLTFLEAYQPDYLYIVGDFLDGWSLQRSWYWRPVNTRILQHLLAWAWAGVTIRYASGNHDGFLRDFICGHIHTPRIALLGEIVYCNTGGWVENCSALLEFDDGELRLVRFCPETGTITRQDSHSPVARVAAVEADGAFSEQTKMETHA